MEHGPTIFVEVAGLAKALGVVAYADGNVLTWRGAAGPVTLFEGSADAVAHLPGVGGPTDVALSAPVMSLDAGWYVPLDALPLLGMDVPPYTGRLEALPLPGGRELQLDYVTAAALGVAPPASPPAVAPAGASGRASWETPEPPLAGVRFFDGEGVSLLLVDLALVPLAAPELMQGVDRAVDRAAEAGTDHVLLLLVTSVAELPWHTALVFTQDGRRTEVRPPYRMLVEAGEVGVVTPASPVIGAVLLPTTFSLYHPITVQWGGLRAEVRFRK